MSRDDSRVRSIFTKRPGEVFSEVVSSLAIDVPKYVIWGVCHGSSDSLMLRMGRATR